MTTLFTLIALACVSPEDVNDFADRDGDGFGAVEAGCVTCVDCDDDEPLVNPAAVEVCNGVDDDCDGDVDGNAEDVATYFLDRDADGFGDSGAPVEECEAPEGYVDVGTDCDDTMASRHPGAAETCNQMDDDCDGEVDEEPVDGVNAYPDADGDLYTSGEPIQLCWSSDWTGYTDATSGDDCDDTDEAVSPDAEEVCNGVDDDCDGDIDEGC